MKKPKHLYHGSTKKIKGGCLFPKKPEDLENKPENLHCAVYATNRKDIAIAMAIISCKGVDYASLKFNRKPFGLIYKGWPKQTHVYLYTLPSENFKQCRKLKTQWYSKKPVKPIKTEKINVKNYLDLIRTARKKEKINFFKKYGEK
jgi:hypothetical protein